MLLQLAILRAEAQASTLAKLVSAHTAAREFRH